MVTADINGTVPLKQLVIFPSLLTGIAPKSSFNQNSMPPLPPIHSNGKGEFESCSDMIRFEGVKWLKPLPRYFIYVYLYGVKINVYIDFINDNLNICSSAPWM